ncbi:unnamed protein product [Paramecium octaurelia]|uniref:Uncharacterized protein n=1 Tax=Paramecium octaurelia TaxID=43137 RepID=A0A8S1XV65_PAROT|nr:unnamed protein product [Paramecium octaurelia]
MNSKSISQSSKLRSLILDPKSINQHLMCAICKELVIDPRECGRCKTLFCSICINTQLEQNQTCQKCSQNIQLNDPHPIIRNLISEIQIKCTNEGCSQQMQISKLDSHLKQCEQEKTKCPHSGCDFKDTLQQMKIHQYTCGYRTKTCQKCKLIHKMNEGHDCLDVVLKKVKIMEEQIKQQNIIISDIMLKVEQIHKKQNDKNTNFCSNEFEQNLDTPKSDKCQQNNKTCICKKGDAYQCIVCKLSEFLSP